VQTVEGARIELATSRRADVEQHVAAFSDGINQHQ
jgi:hypothetical protein